MHLYYWKTLVVFSILHFWIKEVANLSSHCEELLREGLTFICNDSYPEEAKKLYSDGLVYVNMPYSVYEIHGRTSAYFITHGESLISNCGTLNVKDDEVFTCDGKPVWLVGTKPKTYCLSFAFRLTDILIESCTPQAMSASSETAMHYVNTLKTYHEPYDGFF